MSLTKFPCGCKHDDIRWIFVCADCRVPWAELHEQAKEDHQHNRRDQHEASNSPAEQTAD